MPIEIDCPCTYGPYSPKTIAGIKYCGNCKDGKIKVYTQEELNEAVQAEKDTCILDITEYFYELKKKPNILIHPDITRTMDIWRKGLVDMIRKRGEK